MTSHCSILAWEIPWTEEPGRLQSMGPQKRQDSVTKITTRKPMVERSLLYWILENRTLVGKQVKSNKDRSLVTRIVAMFLRLDKYAVAMEDVNISGAVRRVSKTLLFM